MPKKKKLNIWDVFDKQYKIPVDISDMAPNDLRNSHSYWASQWVFCNTRLSVATAELKELQRKHEIVYSRLYLKYKAQYRVSNEEAKIKASVNKVTLKYSNRIAKKEISIELWKHLTQSAEIFQKICSRDQSFREKEVTWSYNKEGRGR